MHFVLARLHTSKSGWCTLRAQRADPCAVQRQHCFRSCQHSQRAAGSLQTQLLPKMHTNGRTSAQNWLLYCLQAPKPPLAPQPQGQRLPPRPPGAPSPLRPTAATEDGGVAAADQQQPAAKRAKRPPVPPGSLPAPDAAVLPPSAPVPAAVAPPPAAPLLGDVPQTPSMIWRRLDRTSPSAAPPVEPPDRPLEQSISNVWAQINAVRTGCVVGL